MVDRLSIVFIPAIIYHYIGLSISQPLLDNVLFCFGNTPPSLHFGQLITSALNIKPVLLKAAAHALAAPQINIQVQYSNHTDVSTVKNPGIVLLNRTQLRAFVCPGKQSCAF